MSGELAICSQMPPRSLQTFRGSPLAGTTLFTWLAAMAPTKERLRNCLEPHRLFDGRLMESGCE
jgi:hypothetical protein